MKRLHIAIATRDIAATVQDYTHRLGQAPALVIPDEYALWRTPTLNFSVRQAAECRPGELRHLGWDDDAAAEFTTDSDCNGIVWENFAIHHQVAEINDIWPQVQFALA